MESSGESILITGGAGFIGSHLARFLAGSNRVTVFDDLSTGSKDRIKDLLETGRAGFIHGDVRDASALRKAAAEADIIFHLAVMNLRECMVRPDEAREINAGGTRNACAAALEARAGLVNISTSGIYGDVDVFPTSETAVPKPATVYGRTMLEAEKIVSEIQSETALHALTVRPFNTYGPGEHIAGNSGEVLPRFILYGLAGLPLPVYGTGEQTRSFTYISDTVRGIAAAASLLRRPPLQTPINIANPTEISVLQAAHAVLDAIGCPQGEIEHLPPRPGDAQRQSADTSLAKMLLGFEASVTLAEGLPHLLKWVRESGVDIGNAPRLWHGAQA